MNKEAVIIKQQIKKKIACQHYHHVRARTHTHTHFAVAAVTAGQRRVRCTDCKQTAYRPAQGPNGLFQMCAGMCVLICIYGSKFLSPAAGKDARRRPCKMFLTRI